MALVEDHQEQGAALVRILRGCQDFCVLACCATASEAITSLPSQCPDVVLVDIGLPGRSGIDVVTELKPVLPHAQFLMLTVMEHPEQVFSALAAGASGYLLKKSALTRLPAAVREAHAGGVPLSVPVARMVLAHFQEHRSTQSHASLTPRELEVLDQLAHGCTYKEVAARLDIALGTVQTHVERIYDKLHVQTRLEALRKTGRA